MSKAQALNRLSTVTFLTLLDKLSNSRKEAWPANGRRFSSLIAADGHFARRKRPSAAISEEKRLPFAG